jgi:hypothetical protein
MAYNHFQPELIQACFYKILERSIFTFSYFQIFDLLIFYFREELNR